MALTKFERPIASDSERVYPRHINQIIDWIEGIKFSEDAWGGMCGEIKSVAWNSSTLTEGETHGWLVCDGRALSRADFANLFARIDVAFGVGDGSTTFNIPSGTDKYFVGAGVTPIGGSVGSNSGNNSHTHTSAAHLHAHTATHSHSGTTSSDGTGSTSSDGSGVTGGPSGAPTIQSGTGTTAAGPNHNHTGPLHSHSGPSHSHTLTSSTVAPGSTDSTTPGATGSSGGSFSLQPLSFAGTWIIHI